MESGVKSISCIIALAFAALTNAFGADLTVTSFTSYAGQTNIVLQTDGDVIFSGGTMSLPALPLGASTGLLSVQAGNDVIISDGTSIATGSGWSVSFLAGTNFSTPGTVIPGVGNITLDGSAMLVSMDGSISFLAGEGVTIGTGSVNTFGGGGISISAVSGSVNTGTGVNGFMFRNNPTIPYLVAANLSGISTAAGGDVSIMAGQDIASQLPAGNTATDAGSGAFGPTPGDVTLIAGGNITGHYVVRNGTGIINAGQNAGLSAAQLALSLISGGWNVTAQDIVLQEVRNPNGVFNNVGSPSSVSYHLFDYTPGAYVTLNASNSVELLGASLPRVAGVTISPLYAPTLNINAGAGGVQISNSFILFPAVNGQLDLSTVNGGSLTSASGSVVQLLMSDSAASKYTAAASFGPSDHAATPVHLDDPVPVQLSISGDMDSVMLGLPKHADINVGGSMNSGGFSVQNLNSNDVTSLSVAGNISGGSQSTASGYVINGPGALDIAASYLNLGGSAGIQSAGPLNNEALASLGAAGADITVGISGNLDMISNSISSIAGGKIIINARGNINVGSTNYQGVNGATRGIFTSTKADVSVIAGGDIELSGSCIAAYDGGNVLVASIYSNVDDSIPGTNSMPVTEVFGNPVQTSSYNFPNGGILAFTFPSSTQFVGNITVLAAQNILPGGGMIMQDPLNGTPGSTAVVMLQTGGEVGGDVYGSGTVNVLTGIPPVFLNAQVNVTNLAAVAGTNVQFTVAAGGIAPLSYQWYKNGTNLPGETNVSLSLTNIRRTDAGTYSIVVSNVVGALTNNIQLHVLVPQLLSPSLAQTNHSLSISFGDADGGTLNAQDIASFVIQTSTNLIDWTTVNPVVSTNGNGGLSFQLPVSSSPGSGFYRILSQ
jgi:hypothetical protein